MACACDYMCVNTTVKEGYEETKICSRRKGIFLRQCVTGFKYLAEKNMEESPGSSYQNLFVAIENVNSFKRGL